MMKIVSGDSETLRVKVAQKEKRETMYNPNTGQLLPLVDSRRGHPCIG